MVDRPDPACILQSLTDPPAFELIFDRHFDAVRRFAQARVGIDVGEDIAADAFAIAFEKRANFDPNYRSARPWLLGIATNLIRHHARSERHRLKALARITFEETEDPISLEPLEAARLAPVVFEALEDVNPDQRETFLLFTLGDLTYEEIAKTLDIPLGTVRSRIFHVRRLLRERAELFEAIHGWRDG